MEIFGDFDDDLFDNNVKKVTEDLAEQISNYKAKHVNFEVRFLLK